MSFLNPITALIAAGVAVPLLVSLYFLKLRRKPMAVPSTLLWKKSVQDLEVNAPFQRIRNSLLLWLQLLLLALLLIVMARPTQRAEVSPGERVVIVIDHSASMNTQDVDGGGTRLDEAKRRALELIDTLDAPGSGNETSGGMIISFAERAAVVQAFTGDRGLLRSAVRAIEPTDQRSRLGPALGLIEPFASAAGDDAAGLTVYVLSDGRVHREGAEALGLPGAEVAFERIGGTDTANLGFVAASARRGYDDPSRLSVFARLSNSSAAAVNANVTLAVDGQVVRTRAVTVRGAEDGVGEAAVTFDLQLSGGATVEVFHDRADALPADDRARLRVVPARRLHVLLVTEGNRYLRGAIRAVDPERLEVVAPSEYEALAASGGLVSGGDGSAGYDLVVFDRYAPAAVPVVSSLSFGAAVPIAGFGMRPSAEGSPTMQAVLTWTRDHPLMRYVVLDDVTLRRPGRLTVPPAARVLAVGLAGPLIAEVRRDGRTHAAVSFDVLDSRWPHHWSFQVFMVNALEVLGLGGSADAGTAAVAFTAGRSATVGVVAGVETVGYSGPVRLSATARRGSASLPAFPRAGFYDAADPGAVRPPDDRLAVNLLDPLESDVRAAGELQVGGGVTTPAAASSLVRREVWAWFAWAALALLGVEWFVYTRRMRV
ncbi:MAG: BatA and WFA domain-containing protein [Planctomycetota bacterium]